MEGTTRNSLWVVEENIGNDEWVGWSDNARATRERARRLARHLKQDDGDRVLRVRQYVRKVR